MNRICEIFLSHLNTLAPQSNFAKIFACGAPRFYNFFRLRRSYIINFFRLRRSYISNFFRLRRSYIIKIFFACDAPLLSIFLHAPWAHIDQKFQKKHVFALHIGQGRGSAPLHFWNLNWNIGVIFSCHTMSHLGLRAGGPPGPTES